MRCFSSTVYLKKNLEENVTTFVRYMGRDTLPLGNSKEFVYGEHVSHESS